MEHKILVDIIDILIIAVILLISRYIIPWMKSVEKIDVISEWALKFVKTAQNIITGEKKGSEKRDYVITLLSNKSKELGLNLSEEEIRVFLEDAYTTMIQEQKITEGK